MQNERKIVFAVPQGQAEEIRLPKKEQQLQSQKLQNSDLYRRLLCQGARAHAALPRGFATLKRCAARPSFTIGMTIGQWSAPWPLVSSSVLPSDLLPCFAAVSVHINNLCDARTRALRPFACLATHHFFRGGISGAWGKGGSRSPIEAAFEHCDLRWPETAAPVWSLCDKAGE